jgi:uncharacterized protein YndB with AHSA1/START domain
MADIRHNLTIKVAHEQVYKAITTKEGLEAWWCKQTTAKPEVGFVNVFNFGQSTLQMKVTNLVPNQKVNWDCMNTGDEWMGTNVSFELEEKNGNTLLRFAHSNWAAVTDHFASCSYDWAKFLHSLKMLCETGAGNPS